MKIISGGQTGVDRGALDAAISLGIPHGGWCPRGRLAEDGRIPDRYQLRETDSPDYPSRTEQNVLDSDATLILYRGRIAGGTEFTLRLAQQHGRPHRLSISTPRPIRPRSATGWRRTPSRRSTWPDPARARVGHFGDCTAVCRPRDGRITRFAPCVGVAVELPPRKVTIWGGSTTATPTKTRFARYLLRVLQFDPGIEHLVNPRRQFGEVRTGVGVEFGLAGEDLLDAGLPGPATRCRLRPAIDRGVLRD